MKTYLNTLLAIDEENGKEVYLVTRGPYTWEHYERVSKEEFIKEISQYKDYAKSTWSQEIKDDYKWLIQKFNLEEEF